MIYQRFAVAFAMTLLSFSLSSCGNNPSSNTESPVSISPLGTTDEALPLPDTDLESFAQCTLDRISIYWASICGLLYLQLLQSL